MIPELLAPAGNLYVLKEAVSKGADAVYFGGDAFGARAYAGNLSHDEVLEAIRLLHMQHRKAYLTVNTLLKSREIEERLFSYLKDFYEAGLDAVLVQDYGVLSFIRAVFPALTIHASTQASISSPSGYAFLKSLGVSRAVPARELSIAEIADLCRIPDMETEVFIHGAMCVSYSGRCLLSGMIGERSANRGRCGQPCRLSYTGICDGRRNVLPGRYPISMKDLCGLRDLPALIDAGVSSLKIEGRMKGAPYVGGVVSIYRKYLDLIAEKGPDAAQVAAEDFEELLRLGNRGAFADVYFHEKNSPDMISFDDSSFHSAIEDRKKETPVSETPKIPVSFTVTARVGEPLSITIASCGGPFQGLSCEVCGDPVEKAQKKATTEAELVEKLKKVTEYGFIAENFSIDLSEKAFVPMSRFNALKRAAAGGLAEKLLSPGGRPVKDPALFFAAVKKQEDAAELFDGREDFASVVSLKQIRALSGTQGEMSLIVPAFLLLQEGAEEILKAEREGGRKLYLDLPPVFRKRIVSGLEEVYARARRVDFSGFFVSQADFLPWLAGKGAVRDEIILGPDLYAFNAYSTVFLRHYAKRLSIPFELTLAELAHLDTRGAVLTAYGRTPVMKTQNCLYRNAASCEEGRCREEREHRLSYIDRKGEELPVVKDCLTCVNTMYNSVPTYLLDRLSDYRSLSLSGIRLDFTDEDAHMISELISAYRAAKSGRAPAADFKFTRGHMKRGVE